MPITKLRIGDTKESMERMLNTDPEVQRASDLKILEQIKEMDRFYTPELEDLRVGYECELYWNQDHLPENFWDKITIGESAFQDINWCARIAEKTVRTPYLTKEQIEAEGWEVTAKMLLANYARTGQDENQYLCKKDNWILIFIPEKKILRFTKLDYSRETTARGGYVDDISVKFTVDLLSINEFRQICKLLKIS